MTPTCQNFSRYSSNTTRPEVVEESNDPFIVHSPIDDIVIPEAHISKMVWSSVFRTPSCFLLIGGIIAALSLLGLLMVTEPEQDKEKQQQEADK